MKKHEVRDTSSHRKLFSMLTCGNVRRWEFRKIFKEYKAVGGDFCKYCDEWVRYNPDTAYHYAERKYYRALLKRYGRFEPTEKTIAFILSEYAHAKKSIINELACGADIREIDWKICDATKIKVIYQKAMQYEAEQK